MQPWSIEKKGLVVGVVLLFIGTTFSSVVEASKVDNGLLKIKQKVEYKLVRVNCYEFKSDGTIEKTTIMLPKSEHFQMRKSLSLTTSTEERLEVYKKFGVLPANVTIQKIKKGYNHYLQTKKINVAAIRKYANSRKTSPLLNVIINFNCRIDAIITLGISVDFGANAIIKYWNAIVAFLYYLHFNLFYLPGIDLGVISSSLSGIVQTWNGTFPDSYTGLLFLKMIILGFVGYYLEDVPLPIFCIYGDYFGYAVSVIATGL
jgi:hypothetical protein